MGHSLFALLARVAARPRPRRPRRPGPPRRHRPRPAGSLPPSPAPPSQLRPGRHRRWRQHRRHPGRGSWPPASSCSHGRLQPHDLTVDDLARAPPGTAPVLRRPDRRSGSPPVGSLLAKSAQRWDLFLHRPILAAWRARTCTSSATHRPRRAGRRTVLTDPLLAHTVGAAAPASRRCRPRDLGRCRLVLISHLHCDHLHIRRCAALGRGVRIVVPRGAGAWLRGRGFPRVDELSAGETSRTGRCGSPMSAPTTAATAGGPADPRPRHRVARLPAGGRRRPSTPAATPTCSTAWPCSAKRAVDVALLPVWGWGPDLGPGPPRPGHRRGRSSG